VNPTNPLPLPLQYPALGEIEARCVNMIARLFNAPLDNHEAEAVGVSTAGSSEACMLAVSFLLVQKE
jgi:glutamate decarboxylase